MRRAEHSNQWTRKGSGLDRLNFRCLNLERLTQGSLAIGCCSPDYMNAAAPARTQVGCEQSLAECANLRVETTFVTSCLVLVNKAFTCHMVKYGYGFFVSGLCGAFIATGNRCKNTLYHSAHHGALAGITLTRFFCLANAFTRLSCVGHELSSNWSVLISAEHYAPPIPPRQRLIL